MHRQMTAVGMSHFTRKMMKNRDVAAHGTAFDLIPCLSRIFVFSIACISVYIHPLWPVTGVLLFIHWQLQFFLENIFRNNKFCANCFLIIARMMQIRNRLKCLYAFIKVFCINVLNRFEQTIEWKCDIWAIYEDVHVYQCLYETRIRIIAALGWVFERTIVV